MKDKPLEFFEDSYRKSKLKIFLCYLAIIVPVAILALLLKSCDPYSEPMRICARPGGRMLTLKAARELAVNIILKK